jgi:hypothetical protein
MGREFLYVVESSAGVLRVLERRQAVRQRIGATVSIALDPKNSLVFDAATGARIPGTRIGAIDGV